MGFLCNSFYKQYEQHFYYSIVLKSNIMKLLSGWQITVELFWVYSCLPTDPCMILNTAQKSSRGHGLKNDKVLDLMVIQNVWEMNTHKVQVTLPLNLVSNISNWLENTAKKKIKTLNNIQRTQSLKFSRWEGLKYLTSNFIVWSSFIWQITFFL